MAKKQKYYVVWQGHTPGIYDNWADCQKQVTGVAKAQYKSYDTLHEAEAAQRLPYDTAVAIGKSHSADTPATTGKTSVLTTDENGITAVRPGTDNPPVLDALAVDAACSGNPGVMEYQGVYIATRQQLFHFKTPVGTNNIGEFLGIVHGLAYLKQHNMHQILYSDSVNAINWVRRKECRTKLPLTPQTADLWNIIRRAEAWLHNNTYTTEIRKWDTDRWGEIPADFNRKK